MSPIPQRSLGGTASGVQVGNIGHGLMMLTWISQVETPDEEAFASMKAAVDAGATFWNSGNFYGNADPLANLKLLRRFFDKYPEYAEPGKIFLSVKGGIKNPKHEQTLEVLREDLKETVEALGSRKKIDLFQVARQFAPVEATVPALKTLISEGYFNHIGLSEVSANSLRKACELHPIAAVEVEASIWALEDELYKVIKTAEELDVAVIGYSPLGRGFLVGKFKTRDDMPDDDARKGYPKFSEENFPINLKIVDALNSIAARRSVATSQLALAYLLQMSPKIIPIPGSSRIEGVLENIAAGNVPLSKEEIAEIDKVLAQFPSPGGRYGGYLANMTWL